jgi:Holliday junction resolvase RusA-like endonuclease
MTEHKVIIEGRFPSMNEFIEANRVHKQKGNKMKQANQDSIAWQIVSQLGKIHINNPVRLHYTFYEPNKKRDLDNISGFFHKVFQDALVNCGVIHNDSWHYIIGFSDEFDVDNRNPRIEVVIQEIEKGRERDGETF